MERRYSNEFADELSNRLVEWKALIQDPGRSVSALAVSRVVADVSRHMRILEERLINEALSCEAERRLRGLYEELEEILQHFSSVQRHHARPAVNCSNASMGRTTSDGGASSSSAADFEFAGAAVAVRSGTATQQRRGPVSSRRAEPYAKPPFGVVIEGCNYYVPGSNTLWHIQTNLSLQKWGIFVHGGIDVFSRLAVFLRASGNNLSSTVLKLFNQAAERYGYPSRVCSDEGRENEAVCTRMMEVRGTGRNSHITGERVQNQRMTRWWVEVSSQVFSVYRDLFDEMEELRLLDPDNEVQVFGLHYVFLPRINRCLDEFAGAWNHHPLSTEHNWTPRRLWVNGMDRRSDDVEVATLDSPSVADTGDDETRVDIVDESTLRELSRIDVLRSSTDEGIDIYEEVLETIDSCDFRANYPKTSFV